MKGETNMKSRKIVIVAFVLIAAIALGIGYAQLSTTLAIGGNATIDLEAAEANFNNKIYFANPAVDTVNSTGTGGSDTKADTIVLTNSDYATIGVQTLAVKDEKAVFTVDIKNDSNVPVLISVETAKLSGGENPNNSNSEYFRIDYAYSRNDMTIPSGESMTVTITVTVIKAVTVATSTSFGIEYTATTVEA